MKKKPLTKILQFKRILDYKFESKYNLRVGHCVLIKCEFESWIFTEYNLSEKELESDNFRPTICPK